ncbi:MAG TPA: PAS-domain containing protein [Dongiaceae bacterium]|nr:PAS-domain containing protein [Dongiaceae bacterium]
MMIETRACEGMEMLASLTALGAVIHLAEDGALRLKATNQTFRDLTKLDDQAATSAELSDVIGAGLDQLCSLAKEAVLTGRPHDLALSLATDHGLRRYQVILLPNQPGWEARDVLLIGTDITSNEAVRHLDGVLTTMRDVLWSVQLGTRQLSYCSRSAESLIGLSPAELMRASDRWRRQIHPDDMERVNKAWAAAENGEPLDVEYRMFRTDGRLIWVHDRGTLVVSRDGSPLRLDGITQDVTQMREVEAKAKEAEFRYQTIVENQAELICRYRTDLTLIFCNEAYAQLYHKSAAELIGQNFADFLLPSELSEIRAVADRLIAGATISHNEQSKLLPDGETAWFSWSDVAIYDADGKIREIQGIGRDVTVRQRIERELHASEQRLRLAIEHIPDAFALYDVNDRLILHNARYIDYEICRPGTQPLGLTFEEIARDLAYSTVVPVHGKEDPEKWLRYRVERHRNPPVEPIEVEVSTGRWLRVSEKRTPDGGYVATWSDITQLKHAEARLLSAIAAFNEGFVLFDKDEKIGLFNQRFVELHPRIAPMIQIGTRLEDFLRAGIENGQFQDVEDDPEAWLSMSLQNARNPGSSVTERRLADDHWVMVSTSGLPGGGFVALVTDLTEVKTRQAELERAQQKLRQQTQNLTQLAEQLRAARIAAETANQAKSRFLAHMSHELRTPLNAILGFADVIRQNMFGEISPSRYRDYAQYIHESGSHLLEMINDVLDLSKIEAGKFELKIEALDAPAIAQSGSKLVAGMAKENGVNLIVDQDICPIVHGDSRAVKQIIINLLSNGVKFTQRGGYVTLQIKEVGQIGTEIIVTDTGIGMSKEDITKALDPFGQIDGTLARRHRGTGLGLPLVKNLAEMQRGFLTIDSAPSRGTRVAVFLPDPSQLMLEATSGTAPLAARAGH